MLHSRTYLERQKLVAQVMRMHLNPEKSRLFLFKEYGIKMAESTYRKYKHELKSLVKDRLYDIAQYGFEEEHVESIDEIEMARKLLWKEYKAAIRPIEKAAILEKIINTRPLLSSYYDSTQGVIEKPVTKENTNLQESTDTESESWAVSE